MIDLQSILEAITIMPFILIYISLLMKIDDYLDRQIEMTYLISQLSNLFEDLKKGVH